MKFTDIMFDLEFLSMKSNPVVISIGAVRFNMKDELSRHINDSFYVTCELQEQIDRGRTIDDCTFRWWMSQEWDVRIILSNKSSTIHRSDMRRALASLSIWCERGGCHPTDGLAGENNAIERVWSHGAACDMAILKNLYDDYGMACPWYYRKVRDTKTLFDHCDRDDIKWALKPEGVTEHHALHDAVNQATAVQVAWKHLESLKKWVET